MLPTITLSTGREIGPRQPCFIVAEIGQNHNGDVYTATRLIKTAVDAEVDAVKLCKRHMPSEMTAELAARPYEGPHSFGPTYGEHRAALELSPEEYAHLKDRMRYNEWQPILFSTVCDVQSLADVEAAIDPPLYKIASRDLDNLPLIKEVASLGKPVILSRGMSGDDEIQAALDVVRQYHDQVILLHCVSKYPCEPKYWGLTEIVRLREKFNVLTGLSDHGIGEAAAIAAVCLGACVIEKHITLSRAMPGTDHAASAEPADLVRLVRDVRKVEECFRSNQRPDVSAARDKLGRSLVAVRTIQPGEVIAESDVTLKSPGTGFHWPQRGEVIGHKASETIRPNTTIRPQSIYGCGVLAIIQARLGSTRFPGKVLEKINGRSVLWHCIQQVSKARSVGQIVVAFPACDRELAFRCMDYGVECHLSELPENDVLGRFCEVIKKHRPRLVVRVCADSPCVDPEFIDWAVESIGQDDYCAAEIDGQPAVTQPNGRYAEVCTAEALRTLNAELPADAPEREHVTQGLYAEPWCAAYNRTLLPGVAGENLAIDTQSDLTRVRAHLRGEVAHA